MLERAFTDENYATLTAFLRDVPGRLRPGGAVQLFFGTSGDAGVPIKVVSERLGHADLIDASR